MCTIYNYKGASESASGSTSGENIRSIKLLHQYGQGGRWISDERKLCLVRTFRVGRRCEECLFENHARMLIDELFYNRRDWGGLASLGSLIRFNFKGYIEDFSNR